MPDKINISTKAGPLSPVEQDCIEQFKRRRGIDRDLFQSIGSADEDDRTIGPAYARGLSLEEAKREFHVCVAATTGASSYDVGIKLLTSACEAVVNSHDSLEDRVHHLNTIAKAMQSLTPHDEIEGQLFAQLTVLHLQSMSWLGRAMRTEKVNFANTYLNAASKLLTRHHETLSALMKYRRGGEQRVHVEHVHVHEGGKAIVGNVSAGAGLNKKNEEGPHATV